MMKTLRMAVLGLALLTLARAGLAQPPSGSEPPTLPVTLSIEAQPLQQAILQFGQQTGLQVSFYQDDVAPGLISPPLLGKFVPEEALRQLLANSGLKYKFFNSRTVAIRPVGAPDSDAPKTSSNSVAVDASRETVRLAQADGNARSDAGRDAASSTESDANEETLQEVQVKGIPEILVRGSRLLNRDIARSRDDVQPYVVFDRQAIDRSGVNSVEEFLRNELTSASASVTAAQQEGGGNTSSIRIRGLESNQTLILIDGHRVASRNASGLAEQVDLNGVPLAAIERIEVLPATASGIYGGGATGGVVNVILRRDYSGVETKLTYGNSFDGGGANRRVDLASGFNLEGGKTNIMLAGSYSESSELLVRDRDYYQRALAMRLRNDPSSIYGAFLPPLGATTNILSVDGSNLTLLPEFGGNSLSFPFTSVPEGYQGVASDDGQGLIDREGQYNLDLADTVQFGSGSKQALLNGPTVTAFSATVRREFTSWLQAFVDISDSKNEGSFASNRVASTFFVPAGSANNPFVQDIWVATPALGADRTNDEPNYLRKAVGGLLFSLPYHWQGEVDHAWSRARYRNSPAASNLAIEASDAVSAGETSDGAPFDVFRDTNVTAVNFSPFLGAASRTLPVDSILRDTSLRLSGPIGWSLPGGKPTLAFLLEHRKESLDDFRIEGESFSSIAYSRWQSIDSAYLEFRVPLLSEQNRIPGMQLLELQLAARRDEYDMTGANSSSSNFELPATRVNRKFASTDPTVGLRFQPIADVTFRGSYGTGFVPPALNLLVPDPPVPDFPAFIFGVTDPQRGEELIQTITFLSGGNPDLRPEESTSRSFGVIVTPRFTPGLRLSLDWTKIEKKDNVTTFMFDQETVNNEALIPGVITRGAPSDGFPVGPILAFNTGAINVARQTVEAYDVALDYQIQTESWGTFAFSSAATRNLHNISQTLSTLPAFDVVGLQGAEKWRGRATLDWEYGPWSVAWTARWIDSYCLQLNCTEGADTVALGSVSVSDQRYHDISAIYRFDASSASHLLANTEVQLAIRNVFNSSPPIVPNAPYYSTLGDPLRAMYSFSLRKSFF